MSMKETVSGGKSKNNVRIQNNDREGYPTKEAGGGGAGAVVEYHAKYKLFRLDLEVSENFLYIHIRNIALASGGLVFFKD